MTVNKEIEFKTFITKEKYEELLKYFNLENNIFSQTNYYFDTEDNKLMSEKTVLRIRQKGCSYKLTKKTRALVGADETNILSCMVAKKLKIKNNEIKYHRRAS